MKTLLSIVVLVLLASTASAQSPDLWGFNPQTQEHDKYLGNLNQNLYDPNSVNNPYGQYGSKYSPDSIRNPYGTYGSPYSPYSPTNPYANGNKSPWILGKSFPSFRSDLDSQFEVPPGKIPLWSSAFL